MASPPSPCSFSLDLGGATIDPSATYTIQASIVDGENAWVTADGIPVLTKGNPSNVAITLSYRPDLLKGAVTGQITGVGVAPSAYGLFDGRARRSRHRQLAGYRCQVSVAAGLPVAFSVPYAITDIVPTNDYVVTAEVGDASTSWRNAAGVPVITKGNPKSGIQVVVTEVAVPSPSPTATPSASPVPAPAPDVTSSGNLLTWIILIAIIRGDRGLPHRPRLRRTRRLPPVAATVACPPGKPRLDRKRRNQRRDGATARRTGVGSQGTAAHDHRADPGARSRRVPRPRHDGRGDDRQPGPRGLRRDRLEPHAGPRPRARSTWAS